MSQCSDGAVFRCSVCDGQVEAMVSEVLEQMLGEVCASEVHAEKERKAEEKRRLEEARSLRRSLYTHYELIHTPGPCFTQLDYPVSWITSLIKIRYPPK